jgi:hypothetical protein
MDTLRIDIIKCYFSRDMKSPQKHCWQRHVALYCQDKAFLSSRSNSLKIYYIADTAYLIIYKFWIYQNVYLTCSKREYCWLKFLNFVSQFIYVISRIVPQIS